MRSWYCQRCGEEKTEPVPATGEHHWDNGTVSFRGTCTEPGRRTYRCRNCGAVMTAATELAPHDWTAVEKVPATKTDDGYTVYSCRTCGRRKTSRDVTVYGDWSTKRPTLGVEDEAESRLQYRFCSLLPGRSVWRRDGSGTIDYAGFPSGFSRSHALYKTYHVQPKANAETAQQRTTVREQGNIGYLYWHWCCNTFANGPINREVTDHRTGHYTCFHAFYSETPPNGLQYITGTYNFPNAECCRDSYWYYCLPVQRQSYTEEKKVTAAGEWGDWSTWSERPVESTPERKVEVRTVYRTASPQLLVLQSPRDTIRPPGLAASFSAGVNRRDVKMQWFTSADGQTWLPCEEGTRDHLTLDVSEDMDGLQVKCVITDSSGAKVSTRVARLRVEYCEKAPLLECSVNPATGKPSLRWGAMKDAVRYQVYRDGQRLKEVSGTRLEDVSAAPGQRCRYQVRAVLAGGKISEWSAAESAACICAQPVVHITHRSDGKPVLQWQAVEGASSYEVWRSVDGGSFTKFYTTRGTRLTNGSARRGSTYVYQVVALSANGAGNSIPSTPVEGRCILPAPSLQLTVKESSGDPYLTWEKVDGAEKYEVWCENGGEMRLLYTTRGDHLTHGSAVPGRTYRYQVRAVGGAFGQELSCVCTCARPDVRLTIHSGDPELRWSAVKGAEKYEVLCSVNGRGYQHLLTVGGTRLHHGSARAGSTYKYRVRALCRTSEGNSALSYTDTAHL